ncbi:hypothetical protein HF521_018742 [Silurus meridionalis]|uniref:Type 2 DNA topoisomerase 6 subunit B-like n=1 Tax=Silurus meridionalis TaxID=175797 RepID=A0A8T0BKE6_SILME|nr:hypothetical protein HF521_018742 [Silurus meridionalis]
MATKLKQVMRVLMVLIRSNRANLRVVFKGGLLMLLSTQTTPAVYTVAAAGRWCSKVSKKNIKKEAVDTLSSFVSLCDCPYPEELCKFSDNFGPLRFAYSFQVDQEGQEWEIERFLQIFSLVHAQITVILKVRNKEHTHQQVFSVKSTHSVLGHAVAMDSTAFGQTPFSVRSLPSCSRVHPVLGETLPLLLPSEAVEAGLCGEVSINTMAVLGPCMKLYPNWPTRISRICISFTLQREFLEMVEFTVGDDHIEDPKPECSRAVSQEVKLEQCHPVEQTLTIFLFIQLNDPFNSQLSDLITNEETLEKYLDKVLQYNGEKMRSVLRCLLENTLKEFLKRKKSSETFQSAMSVILSCVNSIVIGSSNAAFRSSCLKSMKVQNTHELAKSMQQTLQRVINGRYTSRSGCTAQKTEEEAVSGQNNAETCEEGLPGKRAHRDKEQSPLISKRQCPDTTAGDSKASTSGLWENLPSPMTAMFCEGPGEEMCLEATSSGLPCNTEKKNQEVEREWLQELKNLTEWD